MLNNHPLNPSKLLAHHSIWTFLSSGVRQSIVNPNVSLNPSLNPAENKKTQNPLLIGVFTKLDGQLKSSILFTEYVFSRDYPYGVLVESA